MISLTRRYKFSASHRLHSPLLSEAENSRLFGKCNNPFGHGHDYILSLTISGNIDSHTGLLMPLAKLDGFVEANVLRCFAHRNINLDVPQFSGAFVPTTENILRVIAEKLSSGWPSFCDRKIRISKLHMQETGRNSFELLLPALEIQDPSSSRNESVMVHA